MYNLRTQRHIADDPRWSSTELGQHWNARLSKKFGSWEMKRMDQVIAINNLRDEKDATLSDFTHNKLLPIYHHPTDQVIAINNLREHKHRHPKGVRNLQPKVYWMHGTEHRRKILVNQFEGSDQYSHREHTWKQENYSLPCSSLQRSIRGIAFLLCEPQ